VRSNNVTPPAKSSVTQSMTGHQQQSTPGRDSEQFNLKRKKNLVHWYMNSVASGSDYEAPIFLFFIFAFSSCEQCVREYTGEEWGECRPKRRKRARDRKARARDYSVNNTR
jgi:hypothetical protein